MNNKKEIQLLYEKLIQASKIPITEVEIMSPGFYQSQEGKHSIYINKALNITEKLKVLIHEYAHYLHISKFYENESRAECEIIAESTVFFILWEFKIDSMNKLLITELTDNVERLEYLTGKIKAICDEIIPIFR